jgi:hypothetical protein
VRIPAPLGVSGRVFEQDGVTPLFSGQVQVLPERSPDGGWAPYAVSAMVMTDAEGGFVMEGLPPGKVRLQASAFDKSRGRGVEVEAYAGDEDLRIVLGPQGAVALLVTDEATGLAPQTKHVRIEILKDGEADVWSQFTSAKLAEPKEAKQTAWYLVSPGDTVRFRVRAVGYEPSAVLEVTIPPTGGREVLRVPLRAAPETIARLRVRVRFAALDPPPWVYVRRVAGRGSTTMGEPLATDELRLDLLPGANRVDVGRAHRPEPGNPYSFLVPAELRVDLAAGETRDVDVTLAQGGWAVIGGDPDPRPRAVRLVSGARVVEEQATWGTWGPDNETAYLLAPLPAGEWTLEYSERGRGRRAKFSIEHGQVTRLDPATFEEFTVEER